jgi:hypothetical protein
MMRLTRTRNEIMPTTGNGRSWSFGGRRAYSFAGHLGMSENFRIMAEALIASDSLLFS